MRFDSNPKEPEVTSNAALANRRLIGGILVSLLLHALILSLQFGIPGLDLPSLDVPWKERRPPVEALRVEIAGPAPKALPLPPTPAVTKPELFKLPTPILPAPVPKTSSPVSRGMQVLAPVAKSEPVLDQPKKSAKRKSTPPIPPVVKRVPPPAEAPTRIIAQDVKKSDDFVVPLTSEEEVLRNAQDKKEVKQKLEAIPEDAIIDKDAQSDLLIEEKRQEELKQKKLEQEKTLAEQKQREEEQKKQVAKEAEAKLKQQEEQRTAELKRQQLEQLAQQKLLMQREREQALEDAVREAKRQELLTQETLKQEEERRQAEQKRLRQLAQDQEQKKQEALAQAQLRQKQLEEQTEKKRALEIAERKRQDELEAQKAEQLRQAQIAEQRAQEQKIAEQRAIDQKIAEQRAIDQKLAEQALAERRAAEQKAVADAARANAEREVASMSQANRQANLPADTGNGQDIMGQGKTNSANSGLPQNPGSGDLASRLREQARSGGLFKASPSTSKLADDKPSRRRSFLGAYDKEVPLRMYVDSLKQKLERNGNLIYERRTLSDVEHTVLVNMVVRSDGSIEEVTIMRTSGSRAIDERARNIIMANAPFSAFPPALALKYDVIEVQRVWTFGDRLRIMDNLPSSF
jgi:hypothetical protein